MHFDYLAVLQHIFLYEHQKLLLLNLMRVQKFNDTEKNYCHFERSREAFLRD